MKRKPLTVFWGNARVTHAAIIQSQRAETVARMAGEARVLLVQDTTSLDFSGHPGTDGVGPLENVHSRGFFAHSTLAVSTAGVPLGLLAQQVWARVDAEVGKRAMRHERPWGEKESYKWVKGLPTLPAEGPQPVVVCDAEGHIYDFLDVLDDQHLDFIVRAADARSFTEDDQALFEAVAQQPVQAQFTLSLKRRPDREPRDAQVELRFGRVMLKRPHRAESQHATLTLSVVDVVEPNPPPGEEAVHWLLLTSLPVETVADARQITVWYSYRWLIERFHFVLKSGCKLEDRQLRQAARLERLLAVFSVVAWHLLWLTYQARQTPDAPCTVALRPVEWQALFAFVHRTQRLPEAPPSLRQVVRWIGQLGGFLGRKGDGEPGVKVLWRGWQRLQDIAATWTIISSPKDVGNA
jgi:Transposase Tn5 dimerisation domain